MKNEKETINLRHLRVFIAVAETGRISAAAEVVRRSQPAVTQAVAKLEAILETQLFRRSPSGMYLTDSGTVFERRATRALALIEVGCALALRKQIRNRQKKAQLFDHLITSTQLRALLAVAEHGNFSLAARTIGISQPSLHRMARDLEKVSGLELYLNTPQGIALTEAAEELARHARLAFTELRQGVEEIDASRGIDTSHICIGTLPLVRSYVLPKAINDLTSLRPGVQISVIDGPYGDLLHGLRHGHIDLMVGALRDQLPIGDVSQEELFRDSLSIFARAGHPLFDKPAIAVDDLTAYPWVISRKGTPTRDHFDRFFQAAGIEPPSQLVDSASLVLLLNLMKGSDRLTMLSAQQLREEVALGLVRRVPIALEGTERPIGITTRSDWKPTETQSLLLDLLRTASSHRPAFPGA